MISENMYVTPVIEGDMAFWTEDLKIDGDTLSFSIPQGEYFDAGTRPDISVGPVNTELVEGLLFSGQISDSNGYIIESFQDEKLRIGRPTEVWDMWPEEP